MTDQISAISTPERSENDCFEIGGEDFLEAGRAPSGPPNVPPNQNDCGRNDAMADIRIRIGTLLKAESVSFLLGAGASVESGGLTIGAVPFPVERTLHQAGIAGDVRPRIRRWLKVFYLAVQSAMAGEVPAARDAILVRRNKIANRDPSVAPLPVSLEEVLSMLHRWRAAVPENAERLRLDGAPKVDARRKELDECLAHATQALARHCVLPTDEKKVGLANYKALVRKLLTRPLNLKRVNLFTLNYDTLVEQAADAEGVVLLDGFVGVTRRTFRPESYDHDLYFPAETTEGRVHRLDRVLHLYKLHGSISWVTETPTLGNPYGVAAEDFEHPKTQKERRLLIYPTPAKVGETLGMPYAELFRRFAATVARPQSVLFAIGYGFGDGHVNAIIRQALAVPSFTLVVVDPKPESQFLTTLRGQKDRRVWIARGPNIGTFSGFVENVLPDLRDEEINTKVLATHRALSHPVGGAGSSSDAD